MRILSTFHRFQEHFTLTIQLKGAEAPQKVGKMYVGKYFTAKGEFDEVLDAFYLHNVFIVFICEFDFYLIGCI